MKSQVNKLYEISNKSSRRIIGLMSGTSLDGLDIAVCKISGHGLSTTVQLEHFTTYGYEEEFKSLVRKIFSKQLVELELLTLLHRHIAVTHSNLVKKALAEWDLDPEEIDAIASHGQTIYHAPYSLHGNERFGNATFQAGDGDHLAVLTGIITVSDFRQKHIAAGGEGAPLAAYGDYLLFKEAERDVILLNIGGISNFSFLPSVKNSQTLYSTDLGPGNTMMDAWMQLNFPGKYYDEDSKVAMKGKINHALIAGLKAHQFLKAALPRTTGPELFNLDYLHHAQMETNTKEESVENIMATLNRFTADIIIENINKAVSDKGRTIIYASGGGIHNPLLMQTLEENIKGVEWKSTVEKNIDPDAKEAVLFALLANQTLSGNIEDFPGGSANFPAISLGKISFPG